MKLILSAKQHQDADRSATAAGIPSMVLMERAALACVEEIKKRKYNMERILVVCGTGNNGGDGIAVARLLYERGQRPLIFMSGNRDRITPTG